MRDTRKRVTVIFCDVQGSVGAGERFDMEVSDLLISRYHEVIREVVEHHDGAVGPVAGDGVLVVFGMLGGYEDHAVRAVQAAVELRTALAQVNQELAGKQPSLRVRMGIHTGEVLVGPGLGPEQLIGDTPNVAHRLQEAAKATAGDRTLLSQTTLQLVRNAVEVEPVGDLKLKGRDEPVAAFRLLEVDREAPRRPYLVDIPMVGRARELRLLSELYQRTASERICQLVTLLGPGGVGKTRLVQEFWAEVGDAATVLAGHCLPYGDSITYWPMVSMVRRAADIAATDPPATALEKLRGLVDGQEGAARITTGVGQMLGVVPGAGKPAEIAWTLRRFLEILARDKPLVIVVDDLHRGEPTLFDAVEYIAEEIRDAPVLLICIAREELVEQRRTWSGGKLNAFSMRLSPLSEAEETEHIGHVLVAKQLSPTVAARISAMTDRIAALSEGVPLYAEEYVAMLEDLLETGDDQQPVLAQLGELPAPPTIDDLMADRLFRLNPRDRAVIQRAAVVGKQFHVADVVALAPELEPPDIESALEALVRRELIQRDPDPVPFLPREESGAPYKFRHVLMRESAYKGTAKQVRAELHERFASWVEATAGVERMAQFDELIGFHLAEAYQYRLQLGSDSEQDRQLAQRAGERLSAAGGRAANRGNIQVFLKLLDRAVQLLPQGHEARPGAALDLADAFTEVGEFERAASIYQEVGESAKAAKQQSEVMYARLGLLDLMAFRDPERILGGSGEIQEAILLFVNLQDDLGLAKARRLKAYVNFAVGRTRSAELEARRAIKIANEKGLQHLEAKARRLLCIILLWGPAPLDEVVGYAEETLEWARTRGIASLEAGALTVLGRAAAMRGEFELARRHNQQAREISFELGEVLTAAADSMADGLVELLAGDPAAAEAALRAGYEALEAKGGTGPLANVAAMLARALIVQENETEADRLTRICEEIAATSQLDSQIRWRSLRAIILARQGRPEEAESLAREAVTRAEDCEQPDTQAEALADLAEVLRLRKNEPAAAEVVTRAIELYERKGNVVAARRLRERQKRMRKPRKAPEPA